MNAPTQRQHHVVRLLSGALERAGNTHTLPDLMKALKAGDAQLWDFNDSVVVTEILTYPQRVVLHVWLAAGRMEDLTALLPDIEAWGRQHGATLVEATARRGWLPDARRHGFTPAAIVYRKDL